MQWWMRKLRPLACGGVTLGVLQAIQGIDFNSIWYSFLYQLLSTLVGVFVTLFTGGEVSDVVGAELSSPFASFFL